MKIFALLGMFVLAAAYALGAVLAGPLTNDANGHFYYLLKSATWTNSEAQAVVLGGLS